MTSARRFEQDLPALLADLYLAGTPDYRDDLVRQVERTPQRPAWTFPGRWLPMELTTTRVPATRMPWRQLGVLALLAILLAALLAVYAGSQQHALPPPFGVAGNGTIAYSQDGDIYTVDPVSGVAKVIVSGPEVDVTPMFARDGTKIAFLRRSAILTTFDVVVADRDGSNPRVLTRDPIPADTVIEWSADSTAILMTTTTSDVVRYQIDAGSEPAVVVDAARWLTGELRPPAGEQLLYEPDSTPDVDLWIMDADGTDAHLLYRPVAQVQAELDQVRWSPDGALIGFTCAPPGWPDRRNICVMEADGSNMRLLSNEGPDVTETDFVWSPDSTHIAFNRWHLEPDGSWKILPIGVASLTDPDVRDLGPTPASEGSLFDWSPDGTTILSLPARFFRSVDPSAAPARPIVIDVDSNTWHDSAWEVASNVSWQRIAAP
jgi:Tol biopolymer transport system component